MKRLLVIAALVAALGATPLSLSAAGPEVAPAKILVQKLRDKHARIFHTNRIISRVMFARFVTPIDGQANEFEQLDRTSLNVVLGALAIPGVTEVNIQPYELSVQIGDAFDWKDDHIEGMVINHLKTVIHVVYGDDVVVSRPLD